MKSLIGKAVILGLALATASAVGCSSSTHAPSAGSQDGTGTIGMQLTLPGGSQINTVNWTITGPNGFTKTGSVNVQNSLTISFQVGGIPAGNGYSVTLTGSSTDNLVTCSGSSTFNVAGGATTNVQVTLLCRTATADAGTVIINGSTENCATFGSLSVSPSETTIGSTVELDATATGPDTAALSFVWSAPSGTFAPPSGATTLFTCTSPGVVTVTLTLSDGAMADGGVCTSMATTTITCDGAAVDAGPVDSGAVDTGVVAVDSGAVDSGVVAVDSGVADTGTVVVDAGDGCVASGTGGGGAGGLIITGAAGKTCTATEDLFFKAKGATCLQCLFDNFCLDDSVGDVGLECADANSTTRSSLCLADLTCTLGSHSTTSATATTGPDCASGNLAGCFCGNAATCSAPNAANGVCLAQIQASMESTDPNFILNNYTATPSTLGGQFAHGILSCALASVSTDPRCGSCF